LSAVNGGYGAVCNFVDNLLLSVVCGF